jgi:antirestriction protein ArdC
MKRDLYAEVSDRIVAELEAGAAPWVKPSRLEHTVQRGDQSPLFRMQRRAVVDGTSGGIPHAALSDMRRGQHGQTVFFVKRLQVADGDEGDTKIIPMMKAYTVFNVDQCEGLPAHGVAQGPLKVRNTDERDATIDEFLAAAGADIREGHGEAYYRPGDDFISMPRFEAFKSAATFYGVAFHELGHWTGHKSRLDRDLRNRFGEKAYAAEELVAELCAAFLCAEFSIDGDLRHAGYIQSWIGLLKADSRPSSQPPAKRRLRRTISVGSC